MKEFKYILSAILIAGVVLYSGCGGSDGGESLTEQQKAAQSLATNNPWQVSNINSTPSQDVDASELNNLILSFGITGTGSEIAPGPFSATGAPNFITSQTDADWSWSGSGISTITVSNASIQQFTNVSMSPDIDNPTELILSFTVQQNSGGRTLGIEGPYTIVLEPAN